MQDQRPPFQLRWTRLLQTFSVLHLAIRKISKRFVKGVAPGLQRPDMSFVAKNVTSILCPWSFLLRNQYLSKLVLITLFTGFFLLILKHMHFFYRSIKLSTCKKLKFRLTTFSIVLLHHRLNYFRNLESRPKKKWYMDFPFVRKNG